MADWRQYYKDRVVSFEEAVGKVKSGDKIIDGHGIGRPFRFSEYLVKRANELRDVKLACGSTFKDIPYAKPELKDSFTLYSIFNGPASRKAVNGRYAEFLPVSFSQQERVLANWKPDILFTMVTPPDENGNVSMGVSVDYTRTMVDVCPLVIAQVNEEMPWLEGDAVIPVTSIDYFVEHTEPLDQLMRSTNVSDIDRKIAANVASLINDGDTLQIGVGAVPEAVMSLLHDHKHLGIHTEMGSIGMLEMIEAGVVDNSRKTVDKGYTVCSLMGGMTDFYEKLDHYPGILMRRSSEVLDPRVIAAQDNMVCINSAIQVDFNGQVVADMIGPDQLSGVGGQLDFLRGAMMSKGGRSIIAMQSTSAKGKISRIVSNLNPGAAVSDSRYDTMYIVTEYGIADLYGKTIKTRAKELINIAHPDFREQLEREAYEVYRYEF